MTNKSKFVLFCVDLHSKWKNKPRRGSSPFSKNTFSATSVSSGPFNCWSSHWDWQWWGMSSWDTIRPRPFLTLTIIIMRKRLSSCGNRVLTNQLRIYHRYSRWKYKQLPLRIHSPDFLQLAGDYFRLLLQIRCKWIQLWLRITGSNLITQGLCSSNLI